MVTLCCQSSSLSLPHVFYYHHSPHLMFSLKMIPETGWEIGKLLLFNDYKLHEAWNFGSSIRTVLLFDIARVPGEVVVSPVLSDNVADLVKRATS